MIVSRSVLRADHLWRITSTHIVSYVTRPSELIQRLCLHNGLNNLRKMGKGERAHHLDNTKKLKTTDLIWRPVCSQTSADDVEENFNLIDGSEDSNVECGTSGCVVNVVDTIKDSGKAVVQSESAAISEITSDYYVDGVVGTNSMQCFGKHAVSINVGASLMWFIKGKRGMTQKNLEEEMGVKIKFPSSKEEETIIIEGNSLDSVKRASEKVQIIVDEAVKSPSLNYSHFVSLPLAIHPELVDKLVNFQNFILGTAGSKPAECLDSHGAEDNSDEVNDQQKTSDAEVKLEDNLTNLGIDQSIFNKPKTFHLTVLMLKLWNKDRVKQAADVLKEISPKVVQALDGRPVFVRLKGLETMRGSLAKARVLYAPVEEIGGKERLLRACQVIIDAYVEAGLVLEKDAYQKLKLHATVMNASHRRSKTRSRKFDSFDARTIVKQYGSEVWGEYLIREVHLSQRFVFDENGYYHCCTSIPLPGHSQVE
ncbi:unnamed protein product [Rhodiola kirilowii]